MEIASDNAIAPVDIDSDSEGITRYLMHSSIWSKNSSQHRRMSFPCKVPKFAVQADDVAKAPEPVSNDLTETLFDRIKQPPILRMIADRPWGFWHFQNISDNQHVLILSMLKEPPPDTRHGARNVTEILEFCFYILLCA